MPLRLVEDGDEDGLSDAFEKQDSRLDPLQADSDSDRASTKH